MTTKFGLHVNQGSRNGYGDVAGAIPAVVIAVGEGGALVEAKDKSGGRTITIYRDQTVFHDAPNGIDQMDPDKARQTAINLWPRLKVVYDQNPADYYQVTNETGGDNRVSLANIFAFEEKLMELAERDGYKLAVASPAGGSPGDWQIWVDLFVPHIRRAAQGQHIYSRHAYGGVVDPSGSGLLTTLAGVPADGNAGRPFREATYLRQQGIFTPMIITEAGQKAGYEFLGATTTMADFARYDQLCQQHDNIWGFCAWTYGKYQNFPANIQDASAQMADYLRQTGGAQRPTYPVPALRTEPPDDPTTDTRNPAGFKFTHRPCNVDTISQAYNANPDNYVGFGLTGHDGLDFGARHGSPIFAVADGTVERVSTVGGYGNAVYLRHSDGYRTAYAHLKEASVSVGQRVGGGDQIGLCGNTGNVRPVPTAANPFNGTHLHLTLFKDGATARGETAQPRDIIDPTPFWRAFLQAESPPPPTATFERTFIRFNSSVDLNNVQPGQQFTATWTVKNTGSEPWLGSFRFVYVDQIAPATANDTRSRFGARGDTLFRLTGRRRVNPGETISLSRQFTAPTQAGWYASHWKLSTNNNVLFGNPLWIRLAVTTSIAPPPPPPPPGNFQAGMNVNPDAHALDIDRLRGLTWVRLVYKASSKRRTVDDAFNQQYRGILQAYTNAGINCLLVLNQETEWGNGPWSNGNWAGYANTFATSVKRVAQLCAGFGNQVAYQIWNEQDTLSGDSAIAVAEDNFALVLKAGAEAIRQADPDATIVMGGLNSGPERAVGYAKKVRDKLGGLPVDALAYHPYGRFVNFDPFYNQQFGRLGDAFAVFKRELPNLPVWITELGIANNTPIGSEHYEKIARYMREVFNEIADNHRDHVPVLIWFAWSDRMRNAGITEENGSLKAHIGAAFQEMVARGQGADAAMPMEDMALESLAPASADSEFVGFSTTLTNHKAVPAGSTFTYKWQFKNTGGTTWTDDYRLVYAPDEANSDPMLGQTSFVLTDVMTPAPAGVGDTVTITLNFTAPDLFGRTYRSRWELQDPAGNTFGFFYAEITVIPGSTVGTSVQRSDMTFVADETIDDDTRIPEGTAFVKQWRVRNTGVRHWGDGFRLVYVEGDLTMAKGVVAHVIPPAGRNEEVVLSVPMLAPPVRDGQPTTFSSLWRLQDDRGNFFGQSIWVRIVATPTSNPASLGRFNDPAGWYSQLDPRWRNQQIGHGRQTIGAWGCLLTCYAMMLHSYGLQLTPAELNQRLQQIGRDGFIGANVQFVAPVRLLPGLQQGGNMRSRNTPELDFTDRPNNPIGRIDAALAEGHTVLAQVDRTPNDAYAHASTDQHWVILVSRSGDDYLMLDPAVPADQVATQPLTLLRKYGKVIPSRPAEENLKDAIKSALIYRFPDRQRFRLGVDISHHQGRIDWDAMKAKGVSFAYMKATEGTTFTDSQFARNWAEAGRVGIERGAYHYFHNDMDAVAQANHFANTIEQGELPPVGDFEDNSSVANLPDKIKAFLDQLESRTGETPAIYTRASWWNPNVGATTWANDYKVWLAMYPGRNDGTPPTSNIMPAVPFGWSDWWMWQWTDSAAGASYGVQSRTIDLDWMQ